MIELNRVRGSWIPVEDKVEGPPLDQISTRSSVAFPGDCNAQKFRPKFSPRVKGGLGVYQRLSG